MAKCLAFGEISKKKNPQIDITLYQYPDWHGIGLTDLLINYSAYLLSLVYWEWFLQGLAGENVNYCCMAHSDLIVSYNSHIDYIAHISSTPSASRRNF